jgi:hypothetical protein
MFIPQIPWFDVHMHPYKMSIDPTAGFSTCTEHEHFYLDRAVKSNNVSFWGMENLHNEANIVVASHGQLQQSISNKIIVSFSQVIYQETQILGPITPH